MSATPTVAGAESVAPIPATPDDGCWARCREFRHGQPAASSWPCGRPRALDYMTPPCREAVARHKAMDTGGVPRSGCNRRSDAAETAAHLNASQQRRRDDDLADRRDAGDHFGANLSITDERGVPRHNRTRKSRRTRPRWAARSRMPRFGGRPTQVLRRESRGMVALRTDVAQGYGAIGRTQSGRPTRAIALWRDGGVVGDTDAATPSPAVFAAARRDDQDEGNRVTRPR